MVIKRGFKPFVVIRHENEASKSLYKKLGFEKAFVVARIVFTPFESDGKADKEESNGKEEKSNRNSDEKAYENGKENGNHVNGKSNGVNNNHKV